MMSNDPTDDLLRIGGCLDWISPLWNLITDHKPVARGSGEAMSEVYRQGKAQGRNVKLEPDYLRGDWWVTEDK